MRSIVFCAMRPPWTCTSLHKSPISDPRLLFVLGRDIEFHQVRLETFGLDRAVSNSNSHPYAPCDFCGRTKVQPNKKTNQKSKHRRDEISPAFFLCTQVIAGERCTVYSHESYQRAEIKQFRTALVADQKSASQGEGSDKENVVSRNVVLGINRAKKLFRYAIAASHSIEQTRGSQLRAHSRTDIRDQHCEIKQVE